MSHTHQIEAADFAEFKAKVADLYHGLFNGVAVIPVPAPGTVTTGKAPKGTKAKDTASAPAPSETPATSTSEVKAAVGSTATVVPPETEVEEPEDDGLEDEPTVTRDDVKTLLIEAKNKFKDKPTLVGELVASVAGSYGAKKLADVKDEDLPALYAATKKQLG